VFAIVTVSDSSATVNLAAPLLIQPKHRLAIQAILGDGVYPVRAPLGSCDSGRPQIESNPQR
jgi:flagellar assembly factor FliW